MTGLLGNAIYRIVNFGLRMAQPEFFRHILVVGQPLNDPDEHLLVVANHPYGIQDAFLVSLAYDRSFYFVATALNFQTRKGETIEKRHFRGWLLTQCHVLPIVRDRSEGHLSENVRTFEIAAQRIAEGNALGIFAEGDSRGNQWQLLKLKSGAAQIALQVAQLLAKRNRQLNIQVVGLTYTNWDEPFKSTVTLQVSEPLLIEPVDMETKQAVRTARREITSHLTRIMERLVVQIPEAHHDLAGKIAQFYCVEQTNDFARLTAVGKTVATLSESYPEDRKEIERDLDEYLALADELKIYPGEERGTDKPLILAALAIPAACGYLIHWPIIWGTSRWVPRETTVLHALGSKRVSAAIALTLAWYALIAAIAIVFGVWRFGFWGIPLAAAVVIGIAWCGLAASRFYRRANLFAMRLVPGQRRFKRYQQLGAELFRRLEEFRQRGGNSQ